jgi:hypothetical protein
MGQILSRTVAGLKKADDPLILTANLCIAAFAVMVGIFAYLDIGFNSPRLMLLLGVGAGLVKLLQLESGIKLRGSSPLTIPQPEHTTQATSYRQSEREHILRGGTW